MLIEHDLFGKPASTFPDHALSGFQRFDQEQTFDHCPLAQRIAPAAF
jgi:hypothetical protein